VFYGHIGHYDCPTGDFHRPQPDIVITSGEEASLTRQKFTVALNGKRHHAELPLPGTYNLYNALAAIAIANGASVATEKVLDVLRETTAAFGRVEQVKLGSKTMYLLLIKNPAGFTQIVETFLRDQKGAPVLFAINDNPADGRDISWLWDVPLEEISGSRPGAITAGIRGTDMAVRLKYAGIESVPASSLKDAIDKILAATPEGGTGYILPTYTAMLQIRALLAKMTTMDEVWK
jgi:UDP-N-acetylmuramyl tripeptide synthase